MHSNDSMTKLRLNETAFATGLHSYYNTGQNSEH
jgi:hypothetical protein